MANPTYQLGTTIPDVFHYALQKMEGVRSMYAFSTLGAFASLAMELATPAIIAVAINQAVSGVVGSGFWAFLTVTALSWLLGLVEPSANIRWRTAAMRRLTHEGVAKALQLGLPSRRPFDQGDILQRTMGDMEWIGALPGTILQVSTGMILALGSVVALAFIHWGFVAVWLICLIVATILARSVLRNIDRNQTKLSRQSGLLIGLLLDALQGRRTIRVSGTAEREVERVAQPLDALGRETRDMQVAGGQATALMSMSGQVVVILGTIIGIWLLRTDLITAGGLVAALHYSQKAFSAASGVVDNGLFHFAVVRASAKRVRELLMARVATPAMEVDSVSFRHQDTSGLDVAFDGVSVDATADRRSILKDVNLDVAKGRFVAVVGRSGTGKTTLANLIGRLLDPDDGEVRIADIALPNFREDQLASLVAYAFEQPLLTGTIRDTITLGRDASDEEVRDAARLAEADGFISRLPNGYKTPTAAIDLSAGEKQRLGIARALLHSCGTAPCILVFDDATSHLDIATETRVANVISRIASHGTLIIVTHRVSLVRRADLVAWIDKERIRGLAKHVELLSNRDYRRSLLQLEA